MPHNASRCTRSAAHRPAALEPGSPGFVDFTFPGIFSGGFEFSGTSQWPAVAP